MSVSSVSNSGKIPYVQSKFTVHKFRDEICEKKITFQLVKMKDSLLIYVDDEDDCKFKNLSLAMTNKYADSPIGTKLIGDFTEEISKNIAIRLTKLLNKVVYLSFNLEEDRMLVPLVEKRLHQEIKNHPDKF